MVWVDSCSSRCQNIHLEPKQNVNAPLSVYTMHKKREESYIYRYPYRWIYISPRCHRRHPVEPAMCHFSSVSQVTFLCNNMQNKGLFLSCYYRARRVVLFSIGLIRNKEDLENSQWRRLRQPQPPEPEKNKPKNKHLYLLWRNNIECSAGRVEGPRKRVRMCAYVDSRRCLATAHNLSVLSPAENLFMINRLGALRNMRDETTTPEFLYMCKHQAACGMNVLACVWRRKTTPEKLMILSHPIYV